MCVCDEFRHDSYDDGIVPIEEYYIRCSTCRTWITVNTPSHIPDSQRKNYAFSLAAKLNMGERPCVSKYIKHNRKQVMILGEAPGIEWHVNE